MFRTYIIIVDATIILINLFALASYIVFQRFNRIKI